VLACILPVCIIAVLFVYYSYQYKRALVDQRVLETTRALSTVVDRQLALMQASATALATSHYLATGDLAAFHKQARTVLQDYPHYVVILSDASGQELVNTGVPFGKPLPIRGDLDVVHRVFDTGKPATTNLYKGVRTGLYAFGVQVPVFQGNRVVYDLVFSVHAVDFQKVLSQQRIPPEWYAAILDANKVIVARSRFPERYVGRQIFPAGVKQIDERLEGTVEAPGQEGVGVYATFSRSTTTGWTVVIGIPRALGTAYIRRWLMWVVGGIILLSTATMALALFMGRGMAKSIQALIAPAKALGSGEPVEIGQLDLTEANNVGQSLVKASQLLQERTTERERIAGALRLSEEKFAKAFANNAASVAVTRLRDGVFLEVNDTWVELSGYSREEMIGHSSRRMMWPTRDGCARCLRKLREKGWLRGWEQEFVKKSGEVFVTELSAQIWILNGKKLVVTTLVDITARKRAEEALRESESRFRAFFETVAVGTAEVDLHGHFIQVNQYLCQITGYSREELLGVTAAELTHPVDLKRSREQLVSFLRGDSPVLDTEKRFVRKDGSVIWVHATSAMIRDGEGKSLRSACIIQDITARKRAEEALGDSEGRFHAFFETAAVGASEIDLHGRFVQVNQRFCQITGYSREELSGMTVADVTHPEDRARDWEQIMAFVRGRLPIYDVEKRYLRKDGSVIWVHVTSAMIRGAEGNLLRSAGIVQDVTERRRVEEVWRHLSAIVESSYDAIIGKTLDGTITSWNPGAERLYGYSAAEMLGQPISVLLPPDYPNDIPGILRKVANRERVDNFETVRRRKDGSAVEVSLTVSPILDASGKVAGASTIARDISERKQVQEALVRSEKLAATGRLAATIAHEVNNPLEGAMNAVYLARTNPTQASEMLELAEQELRRAAHITQQTLGFYRESSDHQKVTIRKLVEEVLTVYATKLRDRNITVQRRYYCGSGARREGCAEGCERCNRCLLVNAGELRQIISNLLANGIDALSDGGVMQIRVSRSADRVQLTMADNGCGIRAENLKRIFEPFFTTKEAVGTGLGLWIIQQLVHKHNGVIKVRSRLDKGTVFRLTFPQEAPLDTNFGTASPAWLGKSV
jgi:PAS domain S-box-containing protein